LPINVFITLGSDRYFGNDVLLSEDMLIDLYEAKIGDCWRKDGYFLYVLKLWAV